VRLYDAGARERKVSDALALLQDFDAIWEAWSDEERKQAVQAVLERAEADDGFLVSLTPTEEFASLIPPLKDPIWCCVRRWDKARVKAINFELRALRGKMTVREFAEELGVSPSLISALERGLYRVSDGMRQKIEAWKARKEQAAMEMAAG